MFNFLGVNLSDIKDTAWLLDSFKNEMEMWSFLLEHTGPRVILQFPSKQRETVFFFLVACRKLFLVLRGYLLIRTL